LDEYEELEHFIEKHCPLLKPHGYFGELDSDYWHRMNLHDTCPIQEICKASLRRAGFSI
jgi:hypothetical protein